MRVLHSGFLSEATSVLPMSRFCFVTVLLPYVTSRCVGTDRDTVIHCPVHWLDRLVVVVVVAGELSIPEHCYVRHCQLQSGECPLPGHFWPLWHKGTKGPPSFWGILLAFICVLMA